MSRHRPVSELAALDDLAGRRRARVRDHLADCPACRRALAFTRDVRRAAAEVTAPPPPAVLDRILARRLAGDRVILPVAEPGIPRRRTLLPLALGATLVAAVAFAAQLLIRPPAESPAPAGAAPDAVPNAPAAGIAIVPDRQPVDVRIDGATRIEVEATMHGGSELEVRGHGSAADARFRAIGGGVVVSEVAGGRIELRVPNGVRARLFVNGRLELTADGVALRVERSGVVQPRVLLDLGR